MRRGKELPPGLAPARSWEMRGCREASQASYSNALLPPSQAFRGTMLGSVRPEADGKSGAKDSRAQHTSGMHECKASHCLPAFAFLLFFFVVVNYSWGLGESPYSFDALPEPRGQKLLGTPGVEDCIVAGPAGLSNQGKWSQGARPFPDSL